MELFEKVLNNNNFFNTVFLNVRVATEYPSLNAMREHDENMYEIWDEFIREKHINSGLDSHEKYLKYATNYPEFSKIIGIGYGKASMIDGKVKPVIETIIDSNEATLLLRFVDLLDSWIPINANNEVDVRNVPLIAGYNLTNYDIPFFIKRLIKHRNFNSKERSKIPFLMKKSLFSKPWENISVNIKDVHRFNGAGQTYDLNTISLLWGLKKKDNIVNFENLSSQYWRVLMKDKTIAPIIIDRQLKNEIWLMIQYLNTLRVY